MQKDGFDFTDPAESAWKLFEKTGNVNYYMLYKNLIKK
ncbi:MAG: YqzL family protein [Clostridia bacterium]|nr:YqzL family protein [Clostridia bacterium]